MLCGLPFPLPTDLSLCLLGSAQLHVRTALLLPHIADMWDCNAFADEPVGLPVTVENREKYVECLYHYFFDCSEQVRLPSYTARYCSAGSALGHTG